MKTEGKDQGREYEMVILREGIANGTKSWNVFAKGEIKGTHLSS